MSTTVTLNGVSYSIPAVGEGSWGTNVSNYLVALSTGTLSKTGGSFTLTGDIDFGASFGLKSIYYKSKATVSTTGILRLGNAESIGWRDAANSADYLLKVNSSNILEFNGNAIVSLSSGNIDLTNSINLPITAIANNLITNAKLAQMAAHTFKGNNTASTANSLDLTATQLTAELNAMVGDSGSGGTKGLVPAPGVGDATKFLNGAGLYSNPAGAGDVTGPSSAVANAVALYNGTTGKIVKDGGIGTSSQVLVGGTLPAFGNVPAAALPAATTSVNGSVTAEGTTTTSTTFTFNGSGGTSASVTMVMARTGSIVAMYIPAVTATSGTSSTKLSSNTAIPAAYRPTTQQWKLIPIQISTNLSVPGMISINTNGTFDIYRDGIGTNWTNSTSGSGLSETANIVYNVI